MKLMLIYLILINLRQHESLPYTTSSNKIKPTKQHTTSTTLLTPIFEVRNQFLTKIVKLNAINLTEELDSNNTKLFNFASLINSKTHRLQILAKDSKLDSALSPSPNSLNLINKFYIDPAELSLDTNTKFDREQLLNENNCDFIDLDSDPSETSAKSDCLIKLKIAAYDQYNNLAKLFILPIYINDINDWAPKFRHDIYRVNISENLSSRTVIPIEAPVDLDSAKFGVQYCTIENDSSNGVFEAVYNINSKRLFLIVNSPLDRESQPQHSLVLMCSDNSTHSRTSLTVEVVDANDNVPKFKHAQKQLNVSIEENTNSENLIQIEATDDDDSSSPNGQLVYSIPLELNSEEVVAFFYINESNGVIGLRQPLDYEKKKKYVLKIKVEDKGPNSVPIYTDVLVNVLDLNDNSPVAHLSYAENYVVGEEKSNNTVWVYEDEKISRPVTIGYMTINDLDTPASNGFNLSAELISVSYMNTTSSQISYEPEDDGFTFSLVQIVHDYSNLYYALQLSKPIDREQTLFYELKFKLSDNSNSGVYNELDKQQITYTTVRVELLDVNDNAPKFKNTAKVNSKVEYYKFYVSENQLRLNFASVQATDLDFGLNGSVEYRILDENNDLLGVYLEQSRIKYSNSSLNPNYLFYINPDNGSVSLRGELDREQNDLYLFTVRASDKGAPSPLFRDVLVELNIIDENDNQPQFNLNAANFSLNENMPANTLIGNVKAFDADLNPKTDYLLMPFEMNNFFFIDQSNGNLYSRVQFDAEDSSSSYSSFLSNGAFVFQVYARDAELKLDENLDSLSKLNISIHLNDLNDNPPVIVSPSRVEDRLVVLNLNEYNSSIPAGSHEAFNSCAKNSTTISLETVKSVDYDRDAGLRLNSPMHSFKFGFIRRMSWQFVLEIVKTQLAGLNRTSTDLVEFLESLIEVQEKNEIKPIKKVNLRAVFSLAQSNDTRLNNSVVQSSAKLNLNQLCNLNWGVYNFSISVSDNSSSSSLRTDFSVKLFVFNLNSMNKQANRTFSLNKTQLVLLNELVDSWWAQNFNLVASFKRKLEINQQSKQAQNGKPSSDDNGDDIDSITQEYYKFYAASAFARSNLNASSLLNTATIFLLNNSSSSIIALISLFLIVAIILISIITYKHYKESSLKQDQFKKQISSKKKPHKQVLDMNKMSSNTSRSDELFNSNHYSNSKDEFDSSNTDYSINMSEPSPNQQIEHQSTKDLSSSPNLAASRFNNMCMKTSNSILYPAQQQPQTANNMLSSANTNILNEQDKNNSVCDSFTIITSLAAADCGSSILSNQYHQYQFKGQGSNPTGSSASSIVTPIANTTSVLITNSTSTPTALIENQSSTFMSTFIPLNGLSAQKTQSRQQNETNTEEECVTSPIHTAQSNGINDLGYYGSSDYSDNNSFGLSSAKKQIKSSQHQPQRVKYVQPNTANTNVNSATNSSSSFTSSSLLSSPTSTSSNDSSTSPLYTNSSNTMTSSVNVKQQQPIITTLYPLNVYQASLKKPAQTYESVDSGKSTINSKSADVKIYFERFERIYNSEEPSMNNMNGSSTLTIKSSNQASSSGHAKQRNSLTTYSYV